MDLNIACTEVEAARQEYRARLHASSSSSKHSIKSNQMLVERQILLSLQETYMEVHEVKLAEEQARGLHPFDGRDLLVKLEKLCVCVAGVEDERAAEAGKL
jgi:hypothetical protein